MRRLAIGVGLVVIAAQALAQPDGGTWNQWRGNARKTASVAASGPAVALDWRLTLTADPNDPGALPSIVSPGGIAIAENGDVYFKTMDDAGDIVYRVDGATGNILAQSSNLGSIFGAYGGVAIGVNEVYTTTYNGAGSSAIVALDKNTLAVLRVMNGGGAFIGLRGNPFIGSVLNNAGHYNLYVADRNGNAIHAVDSVTGTVMWTYFAFPAAALFSQVGPGWITGNGKQAIAYFANDAFGPGIALEDNGDSTYNIIFEDGDPQNFNWQGSGALSADGSKIYVTTFNDGDTPYLWAIDSTTGFAVWSVPGLRGTPDELNSFGRPVVVGNRVYTAGGGGVVVAFDDNGASYTKAWEYRDGIGEFTVLSAADDGDDVYLYAVRQDPGELVVLRDDGSSYTVITSTNLGGTMMRTLYGNSTAALDGDGNLYIAGGNAFDAGNTTGEIYKFRVGSVCPVDFDGDGATTLTDLALILAEYGCAPNPNTLYNSAGFEGFASGAVAGQDGWTQDNSDPNDAVTYPDPDVIADPTGGGMGNVVRFDPLDGAAGGWSGIARAYGPSSQGIVTIEWDQYRIDTGDNFWVADEVSFAGWWAIQWDLSGAAHAETFGPSVPLTTGVWQHITYTFDFAAHTVTVDVDGATADGGLVDTMINGIAFEVEPTATTGDGPVYLDNFLVTEVTSCATDLDGDGIVGLADLAIVLSEFGCTP